MQPQAHRPVGWPTFVLGGLGVAGLGVFAGFAIQGESRFGRLGECRPACDPVDVDAARLSYRVADVALAVSLVALSAAVVTFLATLAFAPHLDAGILLGGGLAIVLYLLRTMRPRVAILGRHADGTLRDARLHGLPVRLPPLPWVSEIHL